MGKFWQEKKYQKNHFSTQKNFDIWKKFPIFAVVNQREKRYGKSTQPYN